MGSAKKSRKSFDSKHPPQGKASRRFAGGLLWFAITAGIAWALMYYSAPSSQLEPYTKFQKTAAEASADKAENAEEPDSSETLADLHDEETAEPVQTAAAPLPPSGVNLPREALEHISKGMELTEQGKFNAGTLEFEKAAKISPDSPELYSIWGAALRMQKRFKGASKKFARAHELAPNDVEIVFNWGMSAMEDRDSDEAIRLFKKSIELEPDNYLAHNYLGKSYGQKKMYAEEEQSYRKAIELNPDFGWAHFNLGVVLGLQKKYEAAADPFERAIAIDKSFEKPFVIQLLTALGRHNPSPKTPAAEPEKPEPVQETKAEPESEPEPIKIEEKKVEGSDHKMEGSNMKKETTNLKGVIQINGKPITRPSVVFLETKNKMRVPKQKTVELEVVQSGLQFIPQHSVVTVGSSVTFVNQDREVHNIYSKSRNNQFNLGAMAAGSSKTIDFNQAGPVVLRCNMHKDMLGTIFVVPNGYYTEPNEKGEYSFDKVKSQGYLLQVWHPGLDPALVEKQLKPVELNGEDQTIDFAIESSSQPGEIHDLVDPTDYNAIVDNIEKEIYQAIEDWKQGKKSIPRKRMLMAITKHFDGEGLKGAISKSFSPRRSILLEKKLDEIRKAISGIGVKKEDVTEEFLKNKAAFVISQLRNNVRELEARLNPDFEKE